jgi:transposase
MSADTATAAIDEGAILKLEHLPAIERALRRLRLAELIDERVLPDKRSRVTTGQCIEALVVAILTSKEGHPLYRVDQLLAGYDLELGLGWTTPAGLFHDQRLARALDALWKAGADPIVGAVFVHSVQEYALDLEIMHLDTTSSSVHGLYEESRPPKDPEDPFAIPHVTKGRSKDRRGLKQVVFGLAVTHDGAVPAVGHAASGNRSDSLELRYLMKRVAERVPDPRAVTLVGDSKLFSGETLLLARRFGFDHVTLVPKTTALRDEVLVLARDAERDGRLQVLHEKISPRTDELEVWRGCSFDVVYRYEAKDGTVTPIPVRALAVRSSALARQKQGSLERQRDRERRALEKACREQRRIRYKCGPDAFEAARRLEAKRPRFHRLVLRSRVEYVPVKRSRRGRPRRDEPRRTKEVWSVWFEIEPDPGAFERALADESSFVLVTSRPTSGPRAWSDPEVFGAYHDQNLVEGAHHWFKGKLDFAPIFLKTERRIAALAQVYVLALMVYALVQRDARAQLAARRATIAGNIKPDASPTTEVVFRLFEKVTTMRRPGEPVRVENLTTAQVHGFAALGIHVLTRPGVVAARRANPGRATAVTTAHARDAREKADGLVRMCEMSGIRQAQARRAWDLCLLRSVRDPRLL